jgi:hypothetical protein
VSRVAVRYRQLVNGEVIDDRLIAPVDPSESDLELLKRKAESAAEKGWDVAWLEDDVVFATKTRWTGNLCEREFWIEAD